MEWNLKEIALSPSDELRDILNDTVLIGEVTNMMTINSLPELLKDCGVPFDKVYYYGGLYVIICFVTVKDADNFLSDKESWSRWFYWLKAGRKITHTPSQRIANIKITGLPLEFRSISNIKEIADHLGLVLGIDEDIWCRSDLSFCKATILTKYMIKINEEMVISAGVNKFKIGVIEDEILWNPFENFSDQSLSNKDPFGKHWDEDWKTDEEDDGIFDTSMNNHDNMYEEGEIPPDDDGGDGDVSPANLGSPEPAGPPVAEESGINALDADCQSQGDTERVEESRMENVQNKKNTFIFNAGNNMESPITGTTKVRHDSNLQFNGLLNNGSFGPFPMWSNSGGKRVLPNSLTRRPNLVSNEWIISHSPDIQINKRSRAELENPHSPEVSIDLNKDMSAANGVLNEQQLTVEIGNMLGINVDADNEILLDVMGEGVHNGLQ
ncbi:hypothetical protein L2E82_18335 [Cichorium intybus]|uniref:Uncharacterized protein n=1 Tax=Cichorium intybus TaxID=13427 RepID=A0ACB9FB59_CICIN|nr:hypothetical protein L2E82_18335 [Cichorium intybus]